MISPNKASSILEWGEHPRDYGYTVTHVKTGEAFDMRYYPSQELLVIHPPTDRIRPWVCAFLGIDQRSFSSLIVCRKLGPFLEARGVSSQTYRRFLSMGGYRYHPAFRSKLDYMKPPRQPPGSPLSGVIFGTK